jgi:hypothetical protein
MREIHKWSSNKLSKFFFAVTLLVRKTKLNAVGDTIPRVIQYGRGSSAFWMLKS